MKKQTPVTTNKAITTNKNATNNNKKVETNITKSSTQNKPINQQSSTVKKVETVKKQEVVEKKKEMVIHQTELKSFLDVWEKITQEGKSVLFQDQTGNVFTFLKYKGCIIDVGEFLLKQGVQFSQEDLEKFQEDSRVKLRYSLKAGDSTVFYFDKLVTSTQTIDQIYKDCKFYDKDAIFTPSKLKNKDYYINKLLKEGENVDSFGNKGFFEHNNNVKLALLFEGKEQDYLKFIEFNCLNKDLFEIIIVS